MLRCGWDEMKLMVGLVKSDATAVCLGKELDHA